MLISLNRNIDKMNITLLIFLTHASLTVYKDVINLISPHLNDLNKISLILTICPDLKINKKIQKEIFADAALYGYLEVMKYMLANKFEYDSSVFNNAALNGSLDNLRWLLANNFPYNSWVFWYAAYHGSLDNLRWLLANNFPYDKRNVLSYSKDSVVKDWVYKNL